jgi:HAD superfamily hydrolase (TIGR01493 family)
MSFSENRYSLFRGMRQEAAVSVFVFDAYGTLFDVHGAIARHRAATGPDADRLSEIWRAKQLEYTWTLTLAGRYVDSGP